MELQSQTRLRSRGDYRYDKWRNYAIGGSGNPTIFSEGNYYTAPEMPFAKEVQAKKEMKCTKKYILWSKDKSNVRK